MKDNAHLFLGDDGAAIFKTSVEQIKRHVDELQAAALNALDLRCKKGGFTDDYHRSENSRIVNQFHEYYVRIKNLLKRFDDLCEAL